MKSIVLPDYGEKCIEIIERGGYRAWAVGGCVRDLLMGRPVHDIDIASSAPPEELSALFEKTYNTGLAHGTVTVRIGDHLLEVTQLRTEGKYTDHRHPDAVRPARTIEEDLARRDFTVNAMAYHPTRGLTDLFGGREDLKSGTIRCVGDPQERFSEDALRILRAFRFASKLHFSIEQKTAEKALELAPTLSRISRERVQKELLQTLAGQTPEVLKPLIEAGGFADLSLTALQGDLSILKRLDAQDDAALLAALCELSGLEAEKFCRSLKTSRAVALRAGEYRNEHHEPLAETDAQLKMRLNRYGEDYLMFLRYRGGMDGIDLSGEVAKVRRILRSGEPYTIGMLAVSGEELKQLGISGKQTGRVLWFLLEQVLKDPQNNKKEILLKLAGQEIGQ